MVRLNKQEALKHAKARIQKLLIGENRAVFKSIELSEFFEKHKENWLLPKSTRLQDFLKFLAEEKLLENISVTLKSRSSPRYITSDATPSEIVLSLREDSYLTHYTAMFYNDLTINEPKTVFANLEQTPKPRAKSNDLSQSTIDLAFSNAMRTTNHVAEFELFNEKYKAFLLNGQHQMRLGVTDLKVNNRLLPITNIERTLIDITVRPEYGGGVHEVLNAYTRAKNKVSVNALLANLQAMNYVYPYHQSVGFYLEYAGYDKKLVKLAERLPKKFDFYLTYNMKSTKFNSRWKVYYPKELG